MSHPIIMSANAKVRYDALLEAADNHRRIKKLKRNNRGLDTGVASMLSDIVSALNSKVSLQAEQTPG